MTSRVTQFLRRHQRLERLLPARLRLPVRFHAQRLLGALEPEIALLPMLLARRPGVVIDVGANVGVYTYALARLGCVVHAFEPQALCRKTLEAWACRREGVHIHPFGVGSAPGSMSLNVPFDHGRPVSTRASFLPLDTAGTAGQVKVVALDDMQLPPVAFMKIDVEGFEHEVLLGSLELLKRDRPAVLVEINRADRPAQSVSSTVSLMTTIGYSCHFLDVGRVVFLPSGPLSAPPGVYNFLFLPIDGHP